MKIRNKVALSASVLVIAGGGLAWTTGATALEGRGPSQPIGEAVVTYQAPDMVRPSPDEVPSASVSGLFWVSQGDLTFHPVVPCRIVDTRAAVSNGRLLDQNTYSFNAVASDYSLQGGLAGACGVPNRALAVELNVTAANPTAQGFLKLYPYAAAQPNASILNYAPGQTIANTATVGRCAESDGSLCFRDLTVYSETSTHFIVDVLGYYEPPLSAQVDASGVVYGASLGLYYVEKLVAPDGAYGVHFYRDVSSCVFSVSTGWGDALSGAPVFVDAQDLAASPDGVSVRTYDASGAPANYPFQLVVHC